MKLKEVIKATGIKLIGDYNEDLEIKISTDTRTLQKGDFYLPLKRGFF